MMRAGALVPGLVRMRGFTQCVTSVPTATRVADVFRRGSPRLWLVSHRVRPQPTMLWHEPSFLVTLCIHCHPCCPPRGAVSPRRRSASPAAAAAIREAAAHGSRERACEGRAPVASAFPRVYAARCEFPVVRRMLFRLLAYGARAARFADDMSIAQKSNSNASAASPLATHDALSRILSGAALEPL